jgi:putative phosphoesterase
MLVALISDTHLPKGQRRLPERCVELLRASDLIVHAGDWSMLAVVEELRAIGPPVQGVHGNVDSAEVRRHLPAELSLDAGGRTLAVVHDAGPRSGRLARMRRRFPNADAVVFGHSHIPLHEQADDGFQIFNPGSPTERRRSPQHTVGLAHVAHGSIAFELITLD